MITAAQYQAMRARLKPEPAAAPSKRSGVAQERELHAAVLDECRQRGWIAFHGSMAHSTFRTPGEPDFVILTDGGGLLLVECKSCEGKLSVDQQAIAAWARKLSHTIHVVRSIKDFLQVTHLEFPDAKHQP